MSTVLTDLPELDELSPEDLASVKHFIAALKRSHEPRQFFLKHFLGTTMELLSGGTLRCRMPVAPYLLNMAGVVHGGFVSSLADLAQAYAVIRTQHGARQCTTVDLQVQFLRGARGTDLIADARVLRWGRQLAFTACTVHNDRGELVANSTATFYLFSEPPSTNASGEPVGAEDT